MRHDEYYDETDAIAKYTELCSECNYLETTLKSNHKEKELNSLKEKCNKMRAELQEKDLLSQQLDESIAEAVGEEVVKKIVRRVQQESKVDIEEEQLKVIEKILNPNQQKRTRENIIQRVLGILRNDSTKRERKKIQEGWEKVREVKTKTTDIRIRMTLDEKEHMQENSEKYGYNNLSEYIRQVALSNPKKNPAAASIYKYDLSSDKLGLLAYFRSDNPIPDSSFFHIHSTEMTEDQRIIHGLLLMCKIYELESSKNNE